MKTIRYDVTLQWSGWVGVDESHPSGISARRVPDDVWARFE